MCYDNVMALLVEIVEDEKDISEMYRRKFVDAGFDTIIAADGKVGLELAEQKKPDIILLDLMMPVMDGNTMLKLLRATEWGKNVPVFVLTNLGDEDTMKEMESLNIQGYMVKADFVPSQIVEEIKKFALTL